ncbi:hypothetical protein E2C01_041153 [Portunus trituberculatus]|uniref:Uncharacterized protein n=1 Tax=Portunus trituberculatus TaxID=210409 RepID=A0A5B7FR50_PORTR|nr:hypothetical protein [Portunus trituberculatus]
MNTPHLVHTGNKELMSGTASLHSPWPPHSATTLSQLSPPKTYFRLTSASFLSQPVPLGTYQKHSPYVNTLLFAHVTRRSHERLHSKSPGRNLWNLSHPLQSQAAASEVDLVSYRAEARCGLAAAAPAPHSPHTLVLDWPHRICQVLEL